jgi:glycine cleavage system H protein
MVFILVLSTVALFVVFEIIFKLRTKVVTTSSQLESKIISQTKIIERYFHTGHGWALVAKDQAVFVGIDDFTQRFVGSIEKVELPLAGSSIRQGEPLIKLYHKDKSLVVVSPISGTIAELNHKLNQHPRLINDSPYEKGWLAKLIPNKLSVELQNLLKDVAAKKWEDAVCQNFINKFTPKLGIVLQDGGQLIENISDHIDNESWNLLAQEMYPMNVSEQQINLKPLT